MSASKPGQFGEPWRDAMPFRSCVKAHVHAHDGSCEYVWLYAEPPDCTGYVSNAAHELLVYPSDEGERMDAGVAARIVACVNALDGLDPEALKELIEAADNVQDGASLSFGDPRVSYEEWQLEPGAIARLRAALAAFGVRK